MENLKIGTGKHESQIESLIKSGKFKDTPFCRNNKFNALPRNTLLENVIQHMNLCLLSNRKHDESILNYFNLLELSTWPYEKKKNYLCEILKFEIDFNDFGEFVNNNIKSNNISVPKANSTIVVSTAEVVLKLKEVSI